MSTKEELKKQTDDEKKPPAQPQKKPRSNPGQSSLVQTKASSNLSDSAPLSLIQEACTFAKQNNDDPNDHTVQDSCGDSSKQSDEDKRKGLISFFEKGKKQFSECESNPSCMAGMPEEMKAAGKKIAYFIEEINKINKMTPKQLEDMKKQQ